MSVSSYTFPEWVDSEIHQVEINCHPPREPMVKPETRQYHTWWQVLSLARICASKHWLALAITPLTMLWPSPPTLVMPDFTPVQRKHCQDSAR